MLKLEINYILPLYLSFKNQICIKIFTELVHTYRNQYRLLKIHWNGDNCIEFENVTRRQ
jgi:hypothetical protein